MESGTVRFAAEAYAVADDNLNEEIYLALGKDYSENSVALELKNIKGTLIDSMGDRIELDF